MASLIVAKSSARISKTAIQKSLFICTILLIVPFALLQAQKTARILYGEPCCTITEIDAAKSVVTARNIATGQIFRFEVDSRKLLGSLKQGQQLWLNAGRDKVSLDGADPCCTIVSGSGLAPVTDVQPDAAAPCCGVVSIDAGRGLVTARHLTTGRTFQFAAANTAALKPGDRVAADLSAGRVRGVAGISSSSATFEPDYGEPCCNVVSVEPDPAEPCCNVVTIRNDITGQLAHFSAPREIIIGALGITNTAWIENTGEYAVVQSPATGGKVSTYSYPLHIDGGSARTSAASPATSGSDNEAWILTVNPDLRGATGRLVLSVPDEEASLIFHIFKPGTQERIDTWYGSGSSAFLPGTVDVAMWDTRIADVPVVKGMDARIRVGVLSVSFDGSYKIINERGEQVFSACCSEKRKVVLQPGKYRLELPTGQQQEIVIEDGKVTEF